MPRLGLSASLTAGNSGAIGSASVLWKIAIFGAGNPEFNGQYVWDGSSEQEGKPLYGGPAPYGGDVASIGWNTTDNNWQLQFDGGALYVSSDLTTWTRPTGGGDNPAPSSALSYAQDSFISGITLIGANIEYANSDYSRSMSGGDPFVGNAQEDSTIYFTDEYDPPNFVARIYDGKDGLNMYVSNSAGSASGVDLFHWNLDSDGTSPVPSVSAVVYSA